MDLVIRYLFVYILHLKTFSYPHTHNIHTNPLTQIKIAMNLQTLGLYIPHLPIMNISLFIHLFHTFSITHICINKSIYTSLQMTTVRINKVPQLLCNSQSCFYTRLSQIITSKHIKILSLKPSCLLLHKIKTYRCPLLHFNLYGFCRVINECIAVIIILFINNSND